MKKWLISLLLVAGNVLQAAQKSQQTHGAVPGIIGKTLSVVQSGELDNGNDTNIDVCYQSDPEKDLRFIYRDIHVLLRYATAPNVPIIHKELTSLRKEIEKHKVLKITEVSKNWIVVLHRGDGRRDVRIIKQGERIIVQYATKVEVPTWDGNSMPNYDGKGIAVELF